MRNQLHDYFSYRRCRYIGTHTTVQLLNAGYEVAVLDNFSNSCPEALNRVEAIAGRRVARYQVDLRDEPAVKACLAEVKPEAVIHFAGLKAVGESSHKPLEYFHNNITGTLHLLDAMRAADCFQLVFSSSATVYGDPEKRYPFQKMLLYGRPILMVAPNSLLKICCEILR